MWASGLGALVLDNDLAALESALWAGGSPEPRVLQGLLELAERTGVVGAARLLVRRGARPGECPGGGSRLLADAVRMGDLAGFGELLAAGADVNGNAGPAGGEVRPLAAFICGTFGSGAFLAAALERPELNWAPGGRPLADWALEAGNWPAVELLEKLGGR